MLLGFAGYRPPGFAYDTARIYGSHATTKNPKLCAGCHVFAFPVTDPTSGNFVVQATGHLLRPIPCLDAQGKPTTDAKAALAGTMVPLGDAKGTALALMVELLAAGLTGMPFASSTWLRIRMSSPGAEMFTREPKPVWKFC